MSRQIARVEGLLVPAVITYDCALPNGGTCDCLDPIGDGQTNLGARSDRRERIKHGRCDLGRNAK